MKKAELASCLREHHQGLTLTVRVQTRSSRQGPIALSGEGRSSIKWGVHAAPHGGEANEELLESVANYFDLPKSKVKLLQGNSSREKVLLLEGVKYSAVT